MLGDLDIYMNDGRSQPGCSLVNVVSTALSFLSGLSDLAGTAASGQCSITLFITTPSIFVGYPSAE